MSHFHTKHNRSDITYKLNHESNVNLLISDASGKLITRLTSGIQEQGKYKYTFVSDKYGTTGTYIVQLRVNKTIYLKKIVQIE